MIAPWLDRLLWRLFPVWTLRRRIRALRRKGGGIVRIPAGRYRL
jgi:hypothetical protein